MVKNNIYNISKSMLSEEFREIADNNAFVVLDTCFIVDPYFLDVFYPAVKEFNIKSDKEIFFYITDSCISELKKISEGNNTELNRRIAKSHSILRENIRRNHNFQIYPSGNLSDFNDPVLIDLAIENSVDRNVYVITVDKKLNMDIFNLNYLKSLVINPITTVRLDKHLNVLCKNVPYEVVADYDNDDERMVDDYVYNSL
jgi:hypothetical protein